MVKCDSTHKWLQSLKADLKLSLKLVNFIFWRNINTGDIILRPPGSQESFKPPRLPELKVGQLGTEVLCLQTRTGMHFIDNLIVGIFFLNFYYYCYIGCVQYRKVCHWHGLGIFPVVLSWTPSLLLWKIGRISNGKYVFVLKI